MLAASTSAPAPLAAPRLRLYALCGMIAPVFFALMVALEGLVVPGYSQVAQHISDLGAYSLYGSAAILQNVNFWVFGALVVAFSWGLSKALPRSRSVTITLGVFGAGVFLAGAFPDMPVPWPGDVHSFVSIMAFLAVISCQFLAWNRLRHADPAEKGVWGGYVIYCLVSGILSIILLIGPPESVGGVVITGLKQRAFLTIPWLWVELMALRLYRTSK